jgi:hypothetical protein
VLSGLDLTLDVSSTVDRQDQVFSMNSSQSSETDVGQLMEIICGIREEQYAFEKYVALLTFSTWLGWPFAPNVVEFAEIVAAARVILAIDDGEIKVPKAQRQQVIESISRQVFKPLSVASALAEPCLEIRFRAASEEFNLSLWNVAAIAAFFMKCPEEMKPSVNKAFFFIDEGGFKDALQIERGGQYKPYKVAPASLKKSWGSLAVTSPFALSAIHQSIEVIFNLPPDGDSSIKEARTLLKKPEMLKRYFGYARFIQDILIHNLHQVSRDKFMFIQFPKSIPIHAVEPVPFDSDQLSIIKRYKAPIFLPNDETPAKPEQR